MEVIHKNINQCLTTFTTIQSGILEGTPAVN